MRLHQRLAATIGAALAITAAAQAQTLEVIDVEGQPLAANVQRLLQALDSLGAPLSAATTTALEAAIQARDAKKLQTLLDSHVLIAVNINPESRVKAVRGPAVTVLQQGGYTPVILKIANEAGVTAPLRISSPQAGPIFSGGFGGNVKADKDRFLDVEVYAKQPMTAHLSALKAEYVLALIQSSEAGKREATLSFDVGQGTQDLGFRAEVPILFTVRPAVPVQLHIKDFDGKPTTGRFTFRDKLGRIYPPQGKRLAPDFFFQQQVYRHDGGTVLLPPGELTMLYGRGPEYRLLERKISVPEKGPSEIDVKLERWINPMDYGFYSGDHHIHAAGCAHYTNPTEGVFAQDMFLHVKGEGLNVGCNLTWGPCYDFQRQFFEPTVHKLSEPVTVLKYDVEVSGFGSQLLGHVCLLNLRDQTYPGSNGTKEKGWPTWTTPLMRWAHAQGAYCGYAHSASGLQINSQAAAKRLLTELDADKNGLISRSEAAQGLLPEAYDAVASDKNAGISVQDLVRSIERIHKMGYIHREGVRAINPTAEGACSVLPNYVIPEMNGIGAQEICVTSAQGLCDFISAMDTDRVPEWNCWYHVMNCGFPLKASGETDFPCVSQSRVGQGRVYVQLGKIDRIDFGAWCEGLARGRSYVSDGYAHPLQFTVNGQPSGAKVNLDQPSKVNVFAKVAFAGATPLGTANGGTVPPGKTRKVEVIVNGKSVASRDVPADDRPHDITWEVPIERSSWVALRHFPQMHANPVEVVVGGKPIRASRKSALWCIGVIEQLWRVREKAIAEHERAEAHATFLKTIEKYRQIVQECPEGS